MVGLAEKRALVIGVGDDQSIAWSVAEALHRAGATLAITFRDEEAAPCVRSLAARVDASIVMPLDVTQEADEGPLFERIADVWGGLDILVHSIATEPLNVSERRPLKAAPYGLPQAMAVRSLVRVARRAEPLMTKGGVCLAMNFSCANAGTPNANLTRLRSAAVEATIRELAPELGARNIRVNALSPRPVATSAGSSARGSSPLANKAPRRSTKPRQLTAQDVGAAAAFLSSDAARNITGYSLHVDAGWHIGA
jgi:enoyl-[acyl-carrier protein] reductase I